MERLNLCGKALIICPHFDDACYSVGGLLLKNNFQEVDILTVFSQSKHVPNIKIFYHLLRIIEFCKLKALKKIIIRLISLVRRKEDFQYCKRVGASQFVLNMPDSLLRNYANPFVIDEMVESELQYNLALSAIKKSVFFNEYTYILCPLGIGNHIDHLIVFKTIVKSIKDNGAVSASVLFYEDLPYASLVDLSVLNSTATGRTGSIEPFYVDVTDVMALKQRLIEVYHSQYDLKLKPSIFYHASRLSNKNEKANADKCFERLWRLQY